MRPCFVLMTVDTSLALDLCKAVAPNRDLGSITKEAEHSPERVKVQTVIWRCTCMFWRESASRSGHWEAHLRNPKSK
jgi:hypothetical protein